MEYHACLLEAERRGFPTLDDAMIGVHGDDWVKTWFEGVPNCLTEDDAYQLGQIVSLYNMIQAWGLLDYAKDRDGKVVMIYIVCCILILKIRT